MLSRSIIWRGFACTLMSPVLVSTLHGFYEAGRGEVVLNTSTGLRYDSNIFANNLEEEDVIFFATPSLEYRTTGRTIEAVGGIRLVAEKFFDYDEQDTLDPQAFLNLSYPNEVERNYSVTLNALAGRRSVTDDVIGDRLEYEEYSFSLATRYDYSEKFGFGVAPAFAFKDYDEAGYYDTTRYGIGLRAFYIYSEKLDTNVGYRFSTASSDDPADSEVVNHAFFVGARGDLFSKMEGFVEIGAQYNDYDIVNNNGDEVSPYVDLGVTWLASDKTTVTLKGTRDFSLQPTADAVITTAFILSVDHRLTQKLSGSVGVTYRLLDYEGVGEREDTIIGGFMGMRYSFTREFSLNARLNIETRDSDKVASDYERILASIGASFLF